MPCEIFYIPVGNGDFVVHAPLHEVIALVNQAAKKKLSDGFHFDQADPLYPLAQALAKTPTSLKVRDGAVIANFLGLITTRTCNLSCAYCGFGAGLAPVKHMDFDTLITSIDWMVENAVINGKKELNIHFFGGEPFVAWEIVEVAVHRARYLASRNGLTPHFEASTNGVLPEKRARFVGDYFDVVVLSLDGFKKFHDRNRAINSKKGSFETVTRTAKLWSNMPVKMCLRTCVTQDSVEELVAITHWYCTAFQPSVINFETLQSWPKTLQEGLYPPDPKHFARNFVRARAVASSYGVEAVYGADQAEGARHSFCPVGEDTIIVTPDGKINGCYLVEDDWKKRGLDLSLGYIQSGSVTLNPKSLEHLRQLVADKPGCAQCFCKWSCAGGCHVNHSYPGATLDQDFCAQTRIITLCTLLQSLGEGARVDALLSDDTNLDQFISCQNYEA